MLVIIIDRGCNQIASHTRPLRTKWVGIDQDKAVKHQVLIGLIIIIPKRMGIV